MNQGNEEITVGTQLKVDFNDMIKLFCTKERYSFFEHLSRKKKERRFTEVLAAKL